MNLLHKTKLFFASTLNFRFDGKRITNEKWNKSIRHPRRVIRSAIESELDFMQFFVRYTPKWSSSLPIGSVCEKEKHWRRAHYCQWSDQNTILRSVDNGVAAKMTKNANKWWNWWIFRPHICFFYFRSSFSFLFRTSATHSASLI